MKKSIFALSIIASIFVFSCSKNEKITVGSIIFNGAGEWFQEALTGIRDASKDLGVNLIEADCHYDGTVESELIHEQLKSKCDAIVICPLTEEESGKALSDATAIGIPVVTWNTVVKPHPTSQIVVDSTMLGRATGDYLVQYVSQNEIKKLKTVLITNDFYSIGIERCKGFEDAILPLVEKGIVEIVGEARLEHTEETKLSIKKMLEETPDIQFIWCWHQTSLLAVSEVLKEMNRSDILLAGTDMSVAIARDMMGSDIKLIAVTTQQPYELGYNALTNAVKAVKGEEIESQIVIPTVTYTIDEQDALKEYVKTHAKFEAK